MMREFVAVCGVALLPLIVPAAQPAQPPPEPIRIVIECEDMQGVAQDKFGPGPGWQVGRWGHDLYQNMTFGGCWASRKRNAMTDAGAGPAEIVSEITVPADGRYKAWVKYECPPYFNYAFELRIEPLGGGKPVFRKTYGLREAAKHYCFKYKDLTAGNLYWDWGIDHDAAEGYEVDLKRGAYRLVIAKTANPEPAGARSIDAVMITSDLSAVSAPRMGRFPLLDELQRANHLYVRFRNPRTAEGAVRFAWNHWNHRRNSWHSPDHLELVRFIREDGQLIPGGEKGNWPEPVAPGAASPWIDLGPTVVTESATPFQFIAYKPEAKLSTYRYLCVEGGSEPFAVDIALAPDAKGIVKPFELARGEPVLSVLVQPDLYRPEGVAATKTTTALFQDMIAALNGEPRLGPIPKKLRLYADTCAPHNAWPDEQGLEPFMAFREAIGLNTLHCSPHMAPALAKWGRDHGAMVERSLTYHYAEDVEAKVEQIRKDRVERYVSFLSFGDEIGLPKVDVKDEAKVEAFRAFLRERGVGPADLGLAGWEQVKPLASFSSDVAVKIGVLPEARKDDAATLEGLKKLYWYSAEFRTGQGIAFFANKTRVLKEALGDEVQTTANLGGMHPFYWMNQDSFIEAFKGRAMSLAWTEDYTYCQPEASRLVAEFQAAYLRKGASYHDTPMMFFCMAHWPGNNPEQLVQNAVLEWGQNVKDLDFYCIGPDLWYTENYVASRGGLPTLQAIRTLSGMAGLIEDHLLPARTEPARIAILLSQASDIWETEGKGQGAVQPGSTASNVSQEERKNIWYALRYAGYRVDHVTEKDCAGGLLKNYSVLYVCGQNLDRAAAKAVKDWVKAGGTAFATAGAARKDEFDAPLTELDEVFGRGKSVSYERYKGPLRARLELLFVQALDEVGLAGGKKLSVYCSREEFEPAGEAKVLATYKSGKPALIENESGKGRAYYAGTLPGQTWAKAALPVLPQGKGGPHTAAHMTEWLGHDAVAADVILTPARSAKIVPDVTVNRRGVITGRLASDKSTVIPVVNLALEADGELRDVELRVTGGKGIQRAWSCFHAKGNLLGGGENGVAVVRLPTLGPADVVVLEY